MLQKHLVSTKFSPKVCLRTEFICGVAGHVLFEPESTELKGHIISVINGL